MRVGTNEHNMCTKVESFLSIYVHVHGRLCKLLIAN